MYFPGEWSQAGSLEWIYQGKHEDGSNHFAKYILVVLPDKTLS